jgi:hypothetical protein
MEEWKVTVEKMKVKNHKESQYLFLDNFNGIIEHSDGDWMNNISAIYYYANSKQHREDGPAAIGGDGGVGFWLNGSNYSENAWNIEVEKLRKK